VTEPSPPNEPDSREFALLVGCYARGPDDSGERVARLMAAANRQSAAPPASTGP
jgi:hypothetical protein